MDKINMVHSVVCNGKMDIAVFIFEIMYEIMKDLGCQNMDFVVRINDVVFGGLEGLLGIERVQMIKLMEAKAWHHKYDNKKVLLLNIYGKIFWYFSHIFTEENARYILEDKAVFEILDSELAIVKKYCIFSGKIK